MSAYTQTVTEKVPQTQPDATTPVVTTTAPSEASAEASREKNIAAEEASSGDENETFQASTDLQAKPDSNDSISSQPKPQAPMELSPRSDNESDFNNRSSYSNSEAASGYDVNTNECSEFCLDFTTCFGLFDTCCPADSDGCLTSCAVFCGNLLFGCCRCK